LAVSLTIIPFVASRLLRPHHQPNRALQLVMAGIHRLYAPVLHGALNRPLLWFWGALALCIGAFALVPVLGFSLFPPAETPYFVVRV
ncbi:efflux RND transporter permease subunit, partial [Acinetobacter baumannii]